MRNQNVLISKLRGITTQEEADALNALLEEAE